MVAKTLFQVTDDLADFLLPSTNEILMDHLRKIEMTKAQYLEKMAAAFMLEVGVPVSRIELVQQQLQHPQYGWKFYFQVRGQ